MKRILILFIIFLAACTTTEYELLPPQLEIVVYDSNGNRVADANVSLFVSQQDWEEGIHAVITGVTAHAGSVIFENLEEKIYLFRAEKEGLTNDNDIVSFKTPLKKGEKRIIKTKIQ